MALQENFKKQENLEIRFKEWKIENLKTLTLTVRKKKIQRQETKKMFGTVGGKMAT